MKKAVLIIFWISIAVSVLVFFDAIISLATYEGVLTRGIVFYEIFRMIIAVIRVWFSVATVNVVEKAVYPSDISVGRKIATWFLTSVLAGILLLCLKDKHYGHVPARKRYDVNSVEDVHTQLARLKFMLQEGAISMEEYNAEKETLLKEEVM